MRLIGFGILMALASVDCGARASRIEQWPLSDGRVLADLLNATDTTIVLVYDPGECFTCNTVLQQWLERERAHPGTLRLVFTRFPSVQERARLDLYRLRYDGDLVSWRASIPRVYVFDGKIVADSALGRGAERVLLARLGQASGVQTMQVDPDPLSRRTP